MNEALAKEVERNVRRREDIGMYSRRVGSTARAERHADST